ncbi:MAG: hypothetical protein ACJA08_000079 [Cyclobacteriaceae bacterium]|jgi:hypothetical protein
MKYIITILLTIGAFVVVAQELQVNHWKTLEGLEYEKSKDEYGEIYIPKFSDAIREIEGKEIELSGYIIPFEGMFKPDHIIISALPIASCFFCGGAGPESVAEVYLDESVKYTAKKIKVRGTLTLNDNNVDELMYILKEGKLITE